MGRLSKQEWQAQRDAAIRNEQIERCYKQHVPPQIRFREQMEACEDHQHPWFFTKLMFPFHVVYGEA